MSLAYRPAEPEDLSFIIESFLDSFRTSRAAGLISMETWKEVMRPEWARILARPGIEVYVAYHPGDDSRLADLYAWLVIEREYEIPANLLRSGRRSREMVPADVPLVHYCFTKQAYRRMGVMKGLFRVAGLGKKWNYSTRTPVVSAMTEAGKLPHARWLHLVARYEKRSAKPKGVDACTNSATTDSLRGSGHG